MKKILILMTTACAALTLFGCDNDRDNRKMRVSAAVEEAFAARYPDAANVSWQKKHGYAVAKFTLPNGAAVARSAAWFDDSGTWYMTQREIRFAELPEAVRTAFETSEYASWRVDDADRLERAGAETVFVLEAEGRTDGRETEIDLYYSPDGVLVRKVLDAEQEYDYGDYIPAQPADAIGEFIRNRYPGARILDIDREDGVTEVEILDGKTCRELLFDRAANWIYTKTELHRSDVPAPVMQALAASAYAAYGIDDIDHYLRADGEFYRFELKSAAGDIDVDITPEGSLTVVAERPGPGGAVLDATVRDFIASEYPGAVIREADTDHGLLEVEIFHEGREKEVLFNGAKAWVRTEWDVRRSELPAAVAAAIAASEYASWSLDDLEYVETPDGDYYRIELERGEREVKLRVDASGNIR